MTVDNDLGFFGEFVCNPLPPSQNIFTQNINEPVTFEELVDTHTPTYQSLKEWMDEVASNLESKEEIYIPVFEGLKNKVKNSKKSYTGYIIARYPKSGVKNINKSNESYDLDSKYTYGKIDDIIKRGTYIHSRKIENVNSPFNGCYVSLTHKSNEILIQIHTPDRDNRECQCILL